jgi:hypothetical protein
MKLQTIMKTQLAPNHRHSVVLNHPHFMVLNQRHWESKAISKLSGVFQSDMKTAWQVQKKAEGGGPYSHGLSKNIGGIFGGMSISAIGVYLVISN